MVSRSKVLAGFTATVLGVLAVAPRPSQAQTTGLVPVRVKVGALLASQSNTRESVGSVLPAAEVDVRIPAILGANFVSLGIQTRSKDGDRLRVVPLTLTKTFQPPNPVGRITGSPYFGVGGGPYFLNGRRGGESNSKVALGGFGQVGYQFPSKFFVEAKYQLVAGKSAGMSANGLALYVGRAF